MIILIYLRESEFDEEDEDKSLPPNEAELFQDLEIDVEKVEKIEAFFSSDEEDFGRKSVLNLERIFLR